MLKKPTCLVIICWLLCCAEVSIAQPAVNLSNCKRCVLVCEQSVNRIAIIDLDKKQLVWEWRPTGAVKPEHVAWFKYPSDAKPVYNGRYILTTASGGGVSLIRIADKKMVFYAYAGGNTHSAELLPDGNIVSASSTGNYMTIFRTDTTSFPEGVYYENIRLPFGHNVVWDKRRKVLWSASQNQLKSFTYNFDKQRPDLTLKDSIPLPGVEAHDLFPVYGEDALWVTNTTGVYKYNVKAGKLDVVALPFNDVKSMSSGPKGYKVLATHPTDIKKGWWTDEITAADGEVVFKQTGFKMYKVRWFVNNSFSY